MVSVEQPLARRLSSLPRKVLTRYREEGVRSLLAWAWAHVETEHRERRLGIDTRGFIPPVALGYESESPGYDPIPYVCIDAALDSLALDPQRDVFVDIGCGKGRAVVVAATRPFRQVLGIELNELLADQARQQVARARDKLLCQQVQIARADAITFDYPPEMNVIFLWNPFVGTILQQVLDRVRQSCLASPRARTLLYALPEDDPDTLQSLPWLVRRREIATRFRTGVRLVSYQIDPFCS